MTAEDEVRRAAAALVPAFGRNDLPAHFACFSPDATFLFRRAAPGRWLAVHEHLSPAPALA